MTNDHYAARENLTSGIARLLQAELKNLGQDEVNKYPTLESYFRAAMGDVTEEVLDKMGDE